MTTVSWHKILRGSYWCGLILEVALSVHLFGQTQPKPLTIEQLDSVLKGPLKSNPEGLGQLIKQHGLDFIPTQSFLETLPNGEVRDAMLLTAGRQLRIRVCRFMSDDSVVANKFAESMREALKDRKGAVISPFPERISLDETIGTTDACEKDVRQNLMVVLLEGTITQNGSTYFLTLHAISLSPSGEKHPLQKNSSNPGPQTFTVDTLQSTASEVVDWGIKTLQEYVQQ